MDPLSITVSTLALIHVSKEVLLTCYRIRGQIKDADDEISRIIAQVESLTATLDELKDILDTEDNKNTKNDNESGSPITLMSGLSLDDPGKDGERRPAVTALSSAIKSSEAVLKEMSSRLAPLTKPGLKSKLRWPFEASGMTRRLESLARHTATVQLALAAHQARSVACQSRKLDDMRDVSKRAAVLNWYKRSDPELNHRASRERHEQGTSGWIFDAEDFLAWRDSEGESLWLHGIPGAGKTILCSSIIEHMQGLCETAAAEAGVTRVVYFYFDFADAKKQSVTSFLSSVVYQLIAAQTSLSESSAALYEKHSGLEDPTVDELLEVIVAEVSLTAKTYLLIDALDECPKDEREVFFKTFLGSFLPPNLNVLITSRKEPDIDAVLRDTFFHIVCIQSSVVDADVRKHVSNTIARDPTLQRWKPAVRQEILDVIVQGSHGMFRWAVCQLETMKKCLTPAMVRAELKRMPETLDQTYDRILQAVPSLHQPFVQSALRWLAFSTRPLLLQELAEAAVIDPESGAFDPEDSRLVDESLILDLCGTLVTTSTMRYKRGADDWLNDKINVENPLSSWQLTDKDYSIVSLSHYSVKEYLASQRQHRGPLASYYVTDRAAHAFLAECCLLYLLDLNGGEIAPELDFKEYHLLEYAARYWFDHWREAVSQEDEPDLKSLRAFLLRLFDPDPSLSGAYVNWLNVYSPDTKRTEISRFSFRREMRKSANLHESPVYWSAWLGDLHLVRWLVDDRGLDPCPQGGHFQYPVAAAVFHGHIDLVEYFIDNCGLDANLATKSLGSLLQIAAAGGSLPVVEKLVAAGADVNARGGEYNTALVAAASREHDDVVAFLVRHGADITAGSRTHGSSLYQAALAGDAAMVSALLGAGADINAIGSSDGTALYAAALGGSVTLVQTLLRRGADVNQGGDGEFGYPLAAAAKEGHVAVVRALLRAGADPNLAGGHREVTPLQSAIESRDMATFRAVLDAGANPDVTGGLYMNPFQAAYWTGEAAMARVLLERGAAFEEQGFLVGIERFDKDPWFLEQMLAQLDEGDLERKMAFVNAEDLNYGSALHIAVNNRCEEAAWLLLERGACVDAVSRNGSVLACAIDADMVDLAKELIKRGADVRRRHKEHKNPLSLAVYYACTCKTKSFELADMILERRPGMLNEDGDAVFWACYHKDETVLRYLLNKGANLNIVSSYERCTALQYVASKADRNMIELLLELGADINGPLGDHGSIIHYAMRSKDPALVQFFLDKGAVVDDSKPGCGAIWTALTYDRPDLVPVLVGKGADVNATGQRSTPLALAYEKGERGVVKILLDNGAKFAETDINVVEEAIKKRALEDVEEFLNHGLDPYCHNAWTSAVEIAVKKGDTDIIDLLISRGLDLNVNKARSMGALGVACDNNDLSMATFLLDRGADPNVHIPGVRYPLYNAICGNGNLPLLDLLLARGASLSATDGISAIDATSSQEIIARLLATVDTPAQRALCLDRALQSAAYDADLALVTWLLEPSPRGPGASPSALGGGRYGSALHAALSNQQIYLPADVNNRLLVIELLLARGAVLNPSQPVPNPNPKAKAATFASPLALALKQRASSIVNMLLAAGADPNLEGGEFHTPLQTAARFCQRMIPVLLAAGADPRAAPGGRFGTALHAAAHAHDMRAVRQLLEAGADPKVVAGKYGSVVQAAAKRDSASSGSWTAGRESMQTMMVLVEAGADVSAKGGRYGCALQMAAKSGNLEGVRWLVEEMGVGIDGEKEGKWWSVRRAAVLKERWGIVSYLERRFGKWEWETKSDADEEK